MDQRDLHLPRHRYFVDSDGAWIRFFCELSGAAVYTARADADTAAQVWEKEGRYRFNRCRKCGKWICNAMYNADMMECVDCAPWEDVPRFCVGCGTAAEENQIFCKHCGIRLRYGGRDAS